MRKISRHNKYFFVTDNYLSDYSIWSQVGGVLEMGMISFPILYFCSIIMMTLSCHIVNVKPKVKMKNEDVDVLWVCIDFLIFSYLQITPQYGSSMNSGSSSLDLVMVQYFKPSSSTDASSDVRVGGDGNTVNVGGGGERGGGGGDRVVPF